MITKQSVRQHFGASGASCFLLVSTISSINSFRLFLCLKKRGPDHCPRCKYTGIAQPEFQEFEIPMRYDEQSPLGPERVAPMAYSFNQIGRGSKDAQQSRQPVRQLLPGETDFRA